MSALDLSSDGELSGSQRSPSSLEDLFLRDSLSPPPGHSQNPVSLNESSSPPSIHNSLSPRPGSPRNLDGFSSPVFFFDSPPRGPPRHLLNPVSFDDSSSARPPPLNFISRSTRRDDMSSASGSRASSNMSHRRWPARERGRAPVIDLTADDSPSAVVTGRPRASGLHGWPYVSNSLNVIDLEASETANPAHQAQPNPDHQERRSTPVLRRHDATVRSPRALEADDDLQITGWTHTNRANESIPRGRLHIHSTANRTPDVIEPRVNTTSSHRIYYRDSDRAFRNSVQNVANHLDQLQANHRASNASYNSIRASIQSVMGFDYTTAAFTLGAAHTNILEVDDPSANPVEPLGQVLPPLGDPGVGFTRGLKEGEELVCPNCDRELATRGEDNVWVVRNCGHVYCAECGAKKNRSRSKASRKWREAQSQGNASFDNELEANKVPIAPLLHCVADGCNEKTSSAKSMFQLYL